MARRRSLRGTKITGNWWDERPNGRKGKQCEITSGGGQHGSPGSTVDMHSVKECAKICGTHFFDADTLRFFKSRVAERAYHDGRGGAYFTTSEKGPNDVRAYTVRRYDPKKCSVETVGKFQQYGTAKQADGAAKRRAAAGGLERRRRR